MSGQVGVSLRDVMLSQLNYRASAYLNGGATPQRYPFGAHSYYVPAQLFTTADGYLARSKCRTSRPPTRRHRALTSMAG